MELAVIQERLREAIKSSGKTQLEIAKEIGVSQPTVSNYFRNSIFPPLDTFAKLCKILDVSSDYILGITDYK